MPRNSSGIYTQPGGTAAVSGATIDPDAFNSLISDIGSELTGSLPVNGSTGMTSPLPLADGSVSSPAAKFTSNPDTGWYKTTDGIGISVDGTKVAEFTSDGVLDGSGNAYTGAPTIAWADLASASTTDLGAQDTANLRITGTTTITSFGTVASGTTRTLRFAGILILTYNATSLILPTGASITTAAGDTCTAVSLGSGNWIVVNYERASGLPLTAPTAVLSVSTGGGTSGGPITTTGTIVLDTNNSFGIGAYAILENNTGGNISAAAVANGTSLKPVYWVSGVYNTSGTTSGVWRNYSGITLGNGYAGLFQRTE